MHLGGIGPGEPGLDDALARSAAHAGDQARLLDERPDGTGQGGGTIGRHETAADTVDHHLAHDRKVRRHDRSADGEGLHDLEGRAALCDVAGAVSERRQGDLGVLEPRRHVPLREPVLPVHVLGDAEASREAPQECSVAAPR